MKTLVRVELRKLATIRGPRVIVAAASALVIVFAVFAVATAGEGARPPNCSVSLLCLSVSSLSPVSGRTAR